MPSDRYIGLDVHLQSTTIAVVGPSGKRLKCLTVETTGHSIVEAIKAVAGRQHVCLENGTQSQWLAELLEPHVDELVVFLPERTPGHKSDEADAWAMAEKLRVGALKRQVFQPAGELRALRAAVWSYSLVVDDVVRVKNRLRALYRSRGLQSESNALLVISKRADCERQLPGALARSAALLGAELDAMQDLRARAQAQLVEEAGRHAAVRRLMTAPAIGIIRAAEIVAIVVSPARFRTRRQFWSYCGLAIVTRSSADWVRNPEGKLIRMRTFQPRGLNANRNGRLKCVFKGAALQICMQMKSHPLHQHYLRMLEAGTKPNLARLTIARQLSATVLAMWKHQEDYNPARHMAA